MGEANRRKCLVAERVNSAVDLLPTDQVIVVQSIVSDGIQFVSTRLPNKLGDELEIQLGSILWLKNSPEAREIAQASGSSVIADKWYSPLVVAGSNDKTAMAIVFYSPPYSNVGVGMGWIQNSWSESELLSIVPDIRVAIPLMMKLQFSVAPFDIKWQLRKS